MTVNFDFVRKGKTARIEFVDERILVTIDGVRVTIPNPKPRSGRRKYHPCEAHCDRLFDRAAAKIVAWKEDRELKELHEIKEHAFA